MMKDDFIPQNDITYIHQKRKEGNWQLHANLAISIRA
jgi:hypothetical protein